MKTLFTVFIFFFITSFSLAAEKAGTVYDGAVLNEDVTWRGIVLVYGSVTVAPQATLRIEPGTVVTFAATTASKLPNLIIQGRLHIIGSTESPVVLTSENSKRLQVGWGGVVFLSTEKRNLLEHCRIENADVGIEVSFSSITLKNVDIIRARTALLAHDGVIQATNLNVSDAEIGVNIYDSEFEGKDITVDTCKRSFIGTKSAIMLVSPKIINNQQSGFEAEECRIKISDGEFSENKLGAIINGGEGQISMSNFLRNSQTALHLKKSRIKIQRCLFAHNLKDALRIDDGRSLLLNNAFTFNGGYNLYNGGNEIISARKNWWGEIDKDLISEKIFDAASDNQAGVVHIFPWLNEKPKLIP